MQAAQLVRVFQRDGVWVDKIRAGMKACVG